jgi:hypothetical protein
VGVGGPFKGSRGHELGLPTGAGGGAADGDAPAIGREERIGSRKRIGPCEQSQSRERESSLGCVCGGWEEGGARPEWRRDAWHTSTRAHTHTRTPQGGLGGAIDRSANREGRPAILVISPSASSPRPAKTQPQPRAPRAPRLDPKKRSRRRLIAGFSRPGGLFVFLPRPLR